MFCKECGTENLDTQVECTECNKLINNNLPLDGADRTKIIVYFALLILPFMWFGVSIVILLIVTFSIYIMKKDKNFKSIIKAKEYISIYLYVAALVFISIGLLNYGDGWILAIISVVSLLILLLSFEYLFFDVLKKHEIWIINNGIFADYKDEKSFIGKVQTIQKEQTSIADELLKMAELKKQGLITDEEFHKAKEKILEGKL